MSRALVRRSLVASIFAPLVLTISTPGELRAQAGGEVRGTVLDATSGRPVADAQVSASTSRAVVTTGTDGTFRLVGLPSGGADIRVRRLGYLAASQSVIVGATPVAVTFRLRPSAARLDQVVVTGTAAPTTRRALGTSIASVDAATLTGGAPPQTLDAALQGKIVGAQITQNSGNPGGGGISVRLRGTSSLISGSEPLYIVDGVIVDNSSAQLIDLGSRGAPQNRLADINPEDIERIEVIKGAAAAALYGSRANNGVVQIFTKQGRAGPTRVSAASRLTSTSVARTPPVNMYPTSDRFGDTTRVKRYDYFDAVLRDGSLFDNNVAVSGGDPRTRYYLGGAWSDERGLVRNSGSSRRSARVNLSQQLYPRLRLATTADYIRSHVNFQPEGEQSTGILAAIMLTPTTYNFYPVSGVYPHSFIGGGYANPLDVIARWAAPQDVNRFIGSMRADYNVGSRLTVAYTVGYDAYQQELDQFIPRGSLQSIDSTGVARSVVRSSRILNSDAVATLTTHAFGGNVEFQSSLGTNYTNQRIGTTLAAALDLVPTVTLVSAGATPSAGQSRYDLITFGVYGQQTANIANRLYLTGALRYDASSTFGRAQRAQYYPKASVSYVISDEPAFQASPLARLFSSLRLRAALGFAGNQPSIANAYAQYSVYQRVVNSGRVGVVNSTVLGNPAVKPERQREVEGGFDAGFLGGRVALEATYYSKYLTDLLLQTPVPTSTGYSVQLSNVGSMTNKGIELQLRSDNFRSTAFTWTSTIGYSANRNHVVSIAAPFTDPGGYVNRVSAGEPVGYFYGQFYQRNPNGSIKTDSTGLPLRSGQDPSLTPAQQSRKIGDPNPKWLGSVLNEFQLGSRIRARVLLDGTFGNDVFNFSRRAMEIFGTSKLKELELSGKLPVNYLRTRTRIFEEYVESGSFVKLREVALTYDFGALAGFQDVAATFSGRNLRTWTRYSGMDPEINVFGQSTISRGNDFGTLPVPRMFSLGVNLVY